MQPSHQLFEEMTGGWFRIKIAPSRTPTSCYTWNNSTQASQHLLTHSESRAKKAIVLHRGAAQGEQPPLTPIRLPSKASLCRDRFSAALNGQLQPCISPPHPRLHSAKEEKTVEEEKKTAMGVFSLLEDGGESLSLEEMIPDTKCHYGPVSVMNGLERIHFHLTVS